MTLEKLDKTNLERFLSLLNAVQKSVILIRQTPNHNNTIDISISSNNDDADRPDPLLITEVIIVICVLLFWCGSIFIFIRHSQLLRIRHRDLPFRSMKPPMNLNHITVVNRTSDMVIHSKSRTPLSTGLTSSIDNYTINGYQHSDTISLTFSPKSKKQRHTRSFDFNTPSSTTKYSFDKQSEKEQLIYSDYISSEIKRSLVNLHRKSVDNLSSIKCLTSHSTNDISRCKSNGIRNLIIKKRCVQESPV